MCTIEIRNSALCLDNSMKLYILTQELLISGNSDKKNIIIIKTPNLMIFKTLRDRKHLPILVLQDRVLINPENDLGPSGC